jgi:hypothetical protein
MTTTIADPYIEATGGQTVTLRLVDAAGALIDPVAISDVTATLTSIDTGQVLFAGANVTPGTGGRGSINDDGELVITFTAADMAASGTRERQLRRLTYRVTHSGGLVFYGEETFLLTNLAGAPFAP